MDTLDTTTLVQALLQYRNAHAGYAPANELALESAIDSWLRHLTRPVEEPIPLLLKLIVAAIPLTAVDGDIQTAIIAAIAWLYLRDQGVVI